jgi:hypothetical protein
VAGADQSNAPLNSQQAESNVPATTAAPSGNSINEPPLLQSDLAGQTPLPSAAGEPGASGGGGGGGGGGGSSSGSGDPALKFAKHWPISQAFEGSYMPIVFAKLYNTVWQAYCHQALDMAPFRNPSASTFLGAGDWQSYLACAPLIVSWAVVPLASDGISLDTNYGCPNPDLSNPNNPCWPPKITGNPVVIRLLQGFLSIVAVVSCILIGFWFKKPHGSSNDPTSIAAIAAVAGHPQVVADFSCSADTTLKELREKIKGKKYKLSQWTPPDQSVRHGLVPVPEDGDEKAHSFTSRARGAYATVKQSLQVSSMDWKDASMYRDAVFLLYVIAIAAITASYLKDEGNSVFAGLFSDSSFGRRIIFALLAAIVSIYFSRIEQGQ